MCKEELLANEKVQEYFFNACEGNEIKRAFFEHYSKKLIRYKNKEKHRFTVVAEEKEIH